MARRNRRRPDDVRPLSPGYASRRDEGDYIIQDVTGGQAGKAYVCPGCNQEIRPGVPHVVAWNRYQGAEARRHWHTPCWRRGH
ncbi:MAG: hypothetical protein U0R23_01285 [Candidatus Nanopelagicales bacterium]